MGKKNLYGAQSRGDTLNYDPDDLVIIDDDKHAMFDKRGKRKFDEAMVLSIMSQGVLLPIIIKRDGDKAVVVDGKQRTINAREANRRLAAEGGERVLVPCVWKRGDDAKLYEILVTTNELRSGDDAEERACKMQHLMDLGRDEKQVAVAFGVTVQTVKNMLKLLELHPDVRKSIKDGTPVTIAMELSKLPQEEQPAALAKLEASGSIKGARGLEAARNVRKNGTAESTTVRMMSRVAVEDWKKALKKTEGKDAEVAYAVLSRILGSERALSNHPRLKDSLEAAQGEK